MRCVDGRYWATRDGAAAAAHDCVAEVPVTSGDGLDVGTLSLFDPRPRRLSQREARQLKSLAMVAAAHVSLMNRHEANRAESSHVPVRRRERKQQGFKSPGSAQRFLSMHAATYNLFTVPRHLVSTPTHRLFRADAFQMWREAASVAA